MTRRLLISPNKGETAVHGCHCPGDMVVRMHKVLAIPGGVGTFASILKLVFLMPLPMPLPGWCAPRFCASSFFLSRSLDAQRRPEFSEQPLRKCWITGTIWLKKRVPD